MSAPRRGPGLRGTGSGSVARSSLTQSGSARTAAASALLSPLAEAQLDDLDAAIASSAKSHKPAPSSLRRSPSDQSVTDSERSESRPQHNTDTDDEDESDEDYDDAQEAEEEEEEEEAEIAAADAVGAEESGDEVAAAEAQMGIVADAAEEMSEADEEDEALVDAPPTPQPPNAGFAKASSSAAAAAAAAASASAPKAKAKARQRSRAARAESEEDEEATDEDAPPKKNGGGKKAAVAAAATPQKPTKSRSTAAAAPNPASSTGKSSAPAKSRASAAASGHHAAAAASPAKPAKSSVKVAAATDESMEDEEEVEGEEEEKGEADAEAQKKRKSTAKVFSLQKKARRTPSPDDLEIDDDDEPAPAAPRSPVASVLVARSAHAHHSPAIAMIPTITPVPSACGDFADAIGLTQAEGAPEMLSTAKQTLLMTQLQSDIRAEQQEGLAALQALFDDGVQRAGTPSQRAASSRAASAQLPHAARLAKSRFMRAEKIIELIYRGQLSEDVAKRAKDIMLEKLYLFSIEDCAFLLVQRLIMPWRASQHCRDANRCSAAVALDLFPALVLRVMEEEEEIDCSRITGTEHRFSAHAFLDFMMGPMLAEPWSPSLLPDILSMLGDLNFSAQQTKGLVEFVCEQCLPSITVDVLAPVCYRVWMLASRASAHSIVHQAILERCESIEREAIDTYQTQVANAGHSLSATQTGAAARQQALAKAKSDKSTMESASVSALLHWESAFTADPDLGVSLLSVLQKKERGLSTFACGMLFAMMRQSQWTRRCLDVLVDAFSSHLSAAHLATSHDTWLSQTMHSAKIEETEAVDPQQLVRRLMEAVRISSHPTLLPPIQTLGLALIDAGAAMKGAHSADEPAAKREVVDLTDDSPVSSGLIGAGSTQLFDLFHFFPDVRANLLQTVLSRIDGSASSSLSYIRLLKKLTHDRATAQLMSRYSNVFTSSLEWYHVLPSDIGLAYLHALDPLLRSERDIRDFVIRTVHKLLFHPSVDAQLLAINSFFTLVTCRYNASGANSGGSSAFHSSQRAPSSASSSSSSADDEFFASNIGSLRRALDQPHLPVRVAVYNGLNHLFDEHASLQTMILNLLFAHFRRYQVPRAASNAISIVATPTPLLLRKALDSAEKCVVEPLPLLISTIQRMLVHQTRDHPSGADHSISQSSLSQLENVPEDRRSGAHLRWALDQLLSKFESAADLRELGINVVQISEATVDDEAGLSAVLQAHVLHDVMAAFIEFSIVREDADPHSPTSSQASYPPPDVFDPSDPQCVPKMSSQRAQKLLSFFHLFWSLHELLTHPTAKTREAAGAPKKPSTKKRSKKKGDMEDEEKDEDEDEEEEEEEEEDEDEDDDDGGSKKKKKGGAKKSKGRKSSSGKAKPPQKAVHALSRNWKQYHLSMGASIKLFKLSQPHTGVAIGPADRRVLHMSQAADGQTVGDLFQDEALQKWLCTCCYNAMEEWINKRDVSKTDVVRDLHRLAPFLTIIVKANSSTVKAGEPCTEKAQNSGGRKGQETLAYRIVSLFHQSFRCLRSVQGFGRQGSHLCDFFYAMLAPQNRSKVQDHLPSGATVISLDKLLNWCIGMLETHTKALVDKRMFAEAAQALDTLMLLAPALKFGEERHRQLIIQKRMAWTGELCSRGVEDPSVTSSLLEYFWLVLPSVEQRDGILCDVVVALRHASTGDEISGEEEPGQQFTIGEKCIKAAATFCMARIRAYIDEVDVAITEARKSGKAHRSEQSVIVMMERLGFLNNRITHLLSCMFLNALSDAVLRLLVKFLRTTIRAIKLLTFLDLRPSSKTMELVKGISTGMRPILDDYLQWLMEEQAGENEKIKKKGMQAKLKRQGTLYSQVSGSLEKWDNSLLTLSQKSGKCREAALLAAMKRTTPIDFRFELQTPGSRSSIKPEKASPRKATQAASNRGARTPVTPRARHHESPLPRKQRPVESASVPMEQDDEIVADPDGHSPSFKAEPTDTIED